MQSRHVLVTNAHWRHLLKDPNLHGSVKDTRCRMIDSPDQSATKRARAAGYRATEELDAETQAKPGQDLGNWPFAQFKSVLVVMLHPPAATDLAHFLARVWAPAVPAAKLSLLPVAESHDLTHISGELGHSLEQAGLDAGRLVLAGFCGTEGTVLQLATGNNALPCAGVLACGDVLPPLALLSGRHSRFGPWLRLVWNSDEPLFSAGALGDLLRWLRAAGLDAEGTVLDRRGASSEHECGGAEPLPALVRMGGAYLAELVALALKRGSRRPAFGIDPSGGDGPNA